MKLVSLIILFLIPYISFASEVVRLAPLTISVKSSNVSVSSSATAIPTTAMVGRESIAICNNDASTKTAYIGNSSVTTSNGFPLSSSNPCISLDLDDSVVVYGIVASGSADIRTVEAK